MATAPALLSVDEYLQTNYSPDLDFVEGELKHRNVGEYDHGRKQWLIVRSQRKGVADSGRHGAAHPCHC